MAVEISGGAGVGTVYGAQDIQSMTLDALMAMVLVSKSLLLDDQIRSQAGKIQQSNDTLKQANALINEGRVSQNEAALLETTPTWTVTTNQAGNQVINLDNGYSIEIAGKNEQWTLRDANGNQLRVWGDPHVDQNNDGTTDWDFKANSTFVLDDGTKITVGTTPWKGNANYTVTDTLTITRGNQAIQVTGIADNKPQVGQVTMNGRELDAATNDGHVFYETDGVNGWSFDPENTNVLGKSGWSMYASTATTQEVKLDETMDVAMSPAMKKFLDDNGIPYADSDGDGKLTKAEWDTVLSNLKNFTDSLTSTSQLDMTMLQSTMNKYNQTFEQLSNFISKYFQSLNTLTGNIR